MKMVKWVFIFDKRNEQPGSTLSEVSTIQELLYWPPKCFKMPLLLQKQKLWNEKFCLMMPTDLISLSPPSSSCLPVYLFFIRKNQRVKVTKICERNHFLQWSSLAGLVMTTKPLGYCFQTPEYFQNPKVGAKKKKSACHLLSDKIILHRSIFSFASIWKE